MYLLLILDHGTRWGEWSALRPGRALLPGNDLWYPLDRRLGGLQLICTHCLEEKFFSSAGDRTPVVQSVVRHYADWSTPAPVVESKNYF
jgi:hypothetical protein